MLEKLPPSELDGFGNEGLPEEPLSPEIRAVLYAVGSKVRPILVDVGNLINSEDGLAAESKLNPLNLDEVDPSRVDPLTLKC